MTTETEYSREALIEIAKRAMVSQDKWRDRDSSDAQRQRGECLALLEAGCDFEIQRDGACSTNEQTIWLRFCIHDFMWFETADESPGNHTDLFYLPTQRCMEERAGRDWC